jgi:hypothetical protein
MSFKLFIYYCALGGGWAAFLAFAVVQVTVRRPETNVWVRAVVTGGLLGLLVAGAVGLIDAILNAVGSQRFVRLLVCMGLGLVAGAVGGLVGEGLHALSARVGVAPVLLEMLSVTAGWVLAGVLIGATVGAFDLAQAMMAGQALHGPVKKVINGVIGGLLGGLVGGALFGAVMVIAPTLRTSLAVGLVIFGVCIGLLIGLAQVILKEAWVKVEQGFRAGRELMLTKDETVIGRAEGCDVALFGDMGVEKQHARIVLKNRKYLLEHVAEEGETYCNDELVTRPLALNNGDAIRVGRSVLRFGERAKKK